MMNSNQVKALIRSHADGDDSRFYSVAMQIAAQEARSGHGKLAQELRKLVDDAQTKSKLGMPHGRLGPVPIAQPRGELAGLLEVTYPKTLLSDMALPEETQEQLRRILDEQRHRLRIREHGYAPLRKVLLIGPPGTGKSMTATALAGELSLPLFTIQIHAMITKFLGETAAKLRLVFDAIQSTRGVFLFDEFDTIGQDRGTRNDVGEVRRTLNSFLQFIESDDSDSIIVAASNHVAILDRALFRRFDAIIEYNLPSSETALRLMRTRLALLDMSEIDWGEAAMAANDLSHGEIVRACEYAAKTAILEHSRQVRALDLIRALKTRQKSMQ